MKLNSAQWVAIVICIALAIFGATFAGIGAAREASGTSPGDGVFIIVIGTVSLGFSGIVVSLATKLLGKG